MKDAFKIAISLIPFFVIILVPEIKDNTLAFFLLACMAIILLFSWAMKPMTIEALAFITDPDARKDSGLFHPSGAPISVREAKQKNLYQ